MINREIKFRGLDLNNKWVFGDLCQNYEYEPASKFIIDSDCTYHRINPETIGQFTGLKDKEGKEIYEGDVLEHVTDKNITIKKVVYDNQHGAFILRCPNYYQELRATYGDGDMYADNYKIIGNIYEHPHLLSPELTK